MRLASWLRWAALPAAIVLAGLSACAPRATQTARGTWHELRTPRFRAWTDGDPEPVRVLLEDLERFDHVLRALTSAEEREAAPPLRIYVAKDDRSLRSLTGARANIQGLFKPTLRGNYAIVGGGANVEADDPYAIARRAVLFHEYTHYVLSMSGARVPSWYNEGFAEYMSTTAFRDDGRYTIGCVPQHRAAWTKYIEWLPMLRVLSADNVADLEGSRGVGGTGTHVGSDRNPADSYAQSWYAVHYFLADGQRKAQLNRYLQEWAAGVAPAEGRATSLRHDRRRARPHAAGVLAAAVVRVRGGQAAATDHGAGGESGAAEHRRSAPAGRRPAARGVRADA